MTVLDDYRPQLSPAALQILEFFIQSIPKCNETDLIRLVFAVLDLLREGYERKRRS